MKTEMRTRRERKKNTDEINKTITDENKTKR